MATICNIQSYAQLYTDKHLRLPNFLARHCCNITLHCTLAHTAHCTLLPHTALHTAVSHSNPFHRCTLHCAAHCRTLNTAAHFTLLLHTEHYRQSQQPFPQLHTALYCTLLHTAHHSNVNRVNSGTNKLLNKTIFDCFIKR